MKKVITILLTVLVCSVASADFTVTVNTNGPWNGYMNVFDLSTNFMWGSGWGTADLRADFLGASIPPDLYLQSCTGVWNPSDPYWVSGGIAQKNMEANFYQEFFGKDDETLTFNYTVLSNTLAGYTTIGFVKVLDSGSGWATVQSTTMVLNAGSYSIPLTEDGTAITPVMQAGFTIFGLPTSPTDPISSQGVFINTIPEPATIALLGLSGLFLLRRRATK